MITSLYKPYLEQLKIIDQKSYYWPWYDEAWEDTEGLIFRVAVEDSTRVLGFCCFYNQEPVILSKLCVRPRYRRNGIGTLLHHDLLKLAEGRQIQAVLHEDNPYRDWALSWDWVATGIRRGIYPDG